MQRLTANQQLSTLIAIKAAMSQGKRFEAICSELMERSEGAVADAWQRCEMELREGNDYSKSLAATELFDDGVLSILILANSSKRWSIAIDAAIDYLGWCFAGKLPIKRQDSAASEKPEMKTERFDKQMADRFIDELSGAKGLLAIGRAYGIRVVVTAAALEGLRQSTHPDAAYIVANLKVDDSVINDKQ